MKTKNARIGSTCINSMMGLMEIIPNARLVLIFLLAWPATIQAQFTYVTNNGTITITGYTGSGGAVIIPESTNGLPVTSIADNACASLTDITSATIPYSVTNVGQAAFAFCPSLAAITVDPANSSYSSSDGILFSKIRQPLWNIPVAGLEATRFPISSQSLETRRSYPAPA